ncbi:MAG: DUF4147 domain-containing protein [Ahrensia sp.]|nr:DUF4147 domain-containing protein [Ahrensia sp.]
MTGPKQQLYDLFQSGVDAVRGFNAVKNALVSYNKPTPNIIIAVGKAAGDMALGARAHFQKSIETIVVTKYGHVSDELAALSSCEIFESAHPIPDSNSLIAGARLLDLVSSQPQDARLLLLVSGGGSSLVEALQPGISLDQLVALNKGFMADGLTIGAINTERKKISRIKAGGLLAAFSGAQAHVIAISDVEGDSIDVIASGIGAYHGSGKNVEIIIAASNHVARQAIAQNAGSMPVICNEETLYGDTALVADHIRKIVNHGPAGLYIFGGEPTVKLPTNPGRGGRNQHLALLLADKIKGQNSITILVAGTDGSDGPTKDAGAIIDGQTVAPEADVSNFLRSADAGTFLATRNALLTTGPTGTNVMDIVLALKTE